MALQRFGFIVKGTGYDPDRHTARIESSQMVTTVIGISAPEQALLVAKRMVADGVQLIELCGGFGPIWTARVIEAIGGAVRLGPWAMVRNRLLRCTSSLPCESVLGFGDLMPGCNAVIEGKDEAEVMAKGAEHAETAPRPRQDRAQ